MNPILHLDPDSWQARGMPNTSLQLVILPAIVRSNPPFAGARARLHGNRPAARERARMMAAGLL